MGILDNYEAADRAFLTGAILSQESEELLAHLHGLSNQTNINTGTQHRDIIRGITINHILLQRHIDVLQQNITALNKQNEKTQRLVIALAVAALIAGGAQAIAAILPYAGINPSPPIASPPQAPAKQSASPTLGAPQAPGQPTKKTL